MEQILEAIQAGASGDEIANLPIPESYRAAFVRRDDVAMFEAIDRGDLSASTSTLTLLETLVVPYRSGNVSLAESYEAVLANSRGLDLIELDRGVLRAAAQLRASTAMHTPDALQVASALGHRSRSFVTNDRRVPMISGLEVFQLRDYL